MNVKLELGLWNTVCNYIKFFVIICLHVSSYKYCDVMILSDCSWQRKHRVCVRGNYVYLLASLCSLTHSKESIVISMIDENAWYHQ
jgi:hypothetical protein